MLGKERNMRDVEKLADYLRTNKAFGEGEPFIISGIFNFPDKKTSFNKRFLMDYAHIKTELMMPCIKIMRICCIKT